jgi:hypothetical protein
MFLIPWSRMISRRQNIGSGRSREPLSHSGVAYRGAVQRVHHMQVRKGGLEQNLTKQACFGKDDGTTQP